MPASNLAQVKIKGLQTNNSELSEVAAGSLNECNNVVLNRDSILEPRRGFKLYGNSMGGSPSTDNAKQLFVYKDRLLRHYTNTFQFDTGVGAFTSFSGSYSELVSGIKMKGEEVNGNFYFTTSEGVKKLSAKTANDLSGSAGFITQAGGIKALDGEAAINPQPGFFTQNSKVAYRLVWGIKDLNSNLILGTPSQRIVIENPELQLLIKDFNSLLAKLDNESLNPGDELSDTNYVSTYKINVEDGLGTTVRNNLIGLAAKLENDVNLVSETAHSRTTTGALVTSNVATVNFSSVLPAWVIPGITVRISNFTAVNLLPLNGEWLVISTGASSVSFSVVTPDVVLTADAGAKVIKRQFESIVQPGSVVDPATTTMLDDMQVYYDAIVEAIITLDTTQILNPLDFAINFSTQSATVNLTFSIPNGVTAANFFQVYRTAVAQAVGPITLDDIDPGDEMGLVYEANPTSAELAAGSITVHDVTPEAFRGANLYTNPNTGEGILQANERPPIALDINTFKNHTFYANTKTVQRLQFSLLGISNLVSGVSKLIVTNGASTQEYTFVTPTEEVTTFTTVADVAASLAGVYFTVNSARDQTEYYVWYKVSGVGVDPAIADKTGIQVDIITNDTAANVANATRFKLNQYSDFIVTGATTQVIITNVSSGVTTDATIGTSGFSVVIVPGAGENSVGNLVTLSVLPTPSQQVDETARSLVRIINSNSSSAISAYYLSGVNDIPGMILFENKNLAGATFYLGSNALASTGVSFSPALPGTNSITGNTIANPTVVTSGVNHGLVTGNSIVVRGSDSVPSLNGVRVVSVLSASTFSVPLTTTVAGSAGNFFLSTVSSDNEIFPNRVYFSKFQQPEAVPLINYFDVGPKDLAILRIVPLRDSLFVFKEEGVYRISGEGATSGFSLSLFDSSTFIVSADSADVLNNQVYLFTNQGVVAVSDTGISVVSRDIENQLIPLLNASNFTNNTWGVSYESDRAYLLSTITELNEEKASVIFRYNTFTNAWTKWAVSKTAGKVKSSVMYLGAGDTNFIEEERKNFTRTDYADREHLRTLGNNAVNGTTIAINSSANVSVGDVITQVQYLSCYKFNQLLKKLDIDSGVSDSNYFSLLAAGPGANLRSALDNLATKLDNDPGVGYTDFFADIVTYGQTFIQTQEAFNVITALLNADTLVQYSNYPPSTGTTLVESIIETLNKPAAKITIRYVTNFIAGQVVIYNHIPVSITWNVQNFGDSEVWKQVSEAKFMFERTNFTKAVIEYSSDISPAFQATEFTEYGNGTFGNYVFGENLFGGNGDRSPLRTYVPRTKQRCRLLIPRISHNIAREKMSVLGYSMLARLYSTKAYR